MNLHDAVAIYRRYYSERGFDLDYPEGLVVDRGSYWYLPDPQPFIGRRGMIVCKKDGAVCVISSSLTCEMACWAFERGILYGNHDLIITSCLPNLDATIDVLTKTPPSQRGTKPPRGRERWYQRLSTLPAVIFTNSNLC